MSKTFTFTKVTSYDSESDEYYGDEFEREFTDRELQEPLGEILYDYYFRSALKGKITDNETIKVIQNCIVETLNNIGDDYKYAFDMAVDGYEEELKDYLEKEALDNYEG